VYPGRPVPLRHFAYRGPWRYHVRFSTDGKRSHFANRAIVDLVLQELQLQAEAHRFAVMAYCFMPDHLHLLLIGKTEASDCRQFLAAFKQAAGFGCSRRFGIRLWQRYGFDRVLRESEDTRVVARYILENPLRAGFGHSRR
jgi:putative transposase